MHSSLHSHSYCACVLTFDPKTMGVANFTVYCKTTRRPGSEVYHSHCFGVKGQHACAIEIMAPGG